MTTMEAKEMISLELMDSFREWLRDWDEMSDYDFMRKYTYGKGQNKPRCNFEGLKHFMDYEFGGRWLPGWIKEGYPREVIWDLHREAWLSYQQYSNWNARHTGRTDWYYIPQRTAREIWKKWKEEQK